MVKAKEGMEVGPLASFPVIRDVVIDRRPMTEFLARQRLYVVLPGKGAPPRTFKIPPTYDRLVRCTECLACQAECTSFELKNRGFGGPLVFVKLAQLHLDPRDGENRRAQAKAMGVSACLACKTKCRCAVGVPVYRDAIETLL
jgi:succinate dehydrogenase/fumarate reductase-like Fe-S protein